MEIVFFGTAEFGLPAFEQLDKNHEIELAVTQPDRPCGRGMETKFSSIKRKAQAREVPVYQPEDVNSLESLARIDAVGADLFVVVAYGQKMSGKLLGLVGLPVNIHGSLLPKYRGAAPINWAIINGETRTGITTMTMDEGLDSGPILLKRETEIGPDETAGELHDRLAQLAGEAILDTLMKVNRDEITPTPQQGEPSFAPKLFKEDGRIDWTRPSKEVHDLIRGTYPWPGAYSFYDGKRLKLCGSRDLGSLTDDLVDRLPLRKVALDADPGGIIDTGNYGFVVKCGNDTAVQLRNVKPQSKCQMSGLDFVNGYRVQVNEFFTRSP
ncbi:methionyl-tRNA formyltransferase [Candidatus Bipolaricaulota bacterium]|nr:methionyl-tRNA formyltransferase [Candidatus Bipolaricaulota bacterium]